MNRGLALLSFIFLTAFVTISFPDGFVALLVIVPAAAIVIGLINVYSKEAEEKDFLIKVFIFALFARLAFGLLIHVFDLRDFFGGDANTFDFFGNRVLEVWLGIESPIDDLSIRAFTMTGYGINYFVAVIYLFTGQNILAAQSLCGVIGAATCVLVYYCSFKVFNNLQVSRFATLCVAFFPALVIWSGQLLKDGLIVFLLVLAFTIVLSLQEKLNYFYIVLLILAFFGIISLRFYIFYMVAVGVVGSFILGSGNTTQSLVRRSVVVVVLGLGLTYIGVLDTASVNLDQVTNLDRIQNSRSGLANSADSGFGKETDVSTTVGAITAVPIGFIYLMLAPFPWEVGSLRQSFTLPDSLLWWSSMPFLLFGLIYTIKHRLRKAIGILIFTLMLTLSYSIFQGNVGTAYRQRTQIQVFLFIFIAVGIVVKKEERENRRIKRIK
jgi:hypothetical protein